MRNSYHRKNRNNPKPTISDYMAYIKGKKTAEQALPSLIRAEQRFTGK